MAILAQLRFGSATVEFDFDGQNRIRSINYVNLGAVDVHVRIRRTVSEEMVHEIAIVAGQPSTSSSLPGNKRYSIDELVFDWSWAT